MKPNELDHQDIKNLVIRPQILKRDAYKCNCCGIMHKQRVYINSRGAYVVCDEFQEAWAKEQGKKVFTVHLNVINTNSLILSNDPAEYLTLCPKHGQMFNQKLITDFRTKFKEKIKHVKTKKETEFDFYSIGILAELVRDVKLITGFKLSLNEADSIVSNLINNTK